MRTRPPGLGDLEAAEWAPPSESGHNRWGIDVWYLRSFNGMVGEGTAFLVDLDDGRWWASAISSSAPADASPR